MQLIVDAKGLVQMRYNLKQETIYNGRAVALINNHR